MSNGVIIPFLTSRVTAESFGVMEVTSRYADDSRKILRRFSSCPLTSSMRTNDDNRNRHPCRSSDPANPASTSRVHLDASILFAFQARITWLTHLQFLLYISVRDGAFWLRLIVNTRSNARSVKDANAKKSLIKSEIFKKTAKIWFTFLDDVLC